MCSQNSSQCLTLDIGASSCRLIKVGFQKDRFFMREVFRTPNGPEQKGDHLLWPLDSLMENTIKALTKAATEDNDYLSIGVDTWGVDYILLNENNIPLSPSVAYRDQRTNGMIAHFTQKVLSKAQIYSKTGIQFQSFNTLYQLYSQTQTEPELLAQAKTLLFIPDYFHFLLSGTATIEKTIASTSQMWNINDQCWDTDLTDVLALPKEALATPIEPGTEIGILKPELCKKTGLPSLRVIAPASHDTASAVLAVPAEKKDWAYLSSGTWSLLGIESNKPITCEGALEANWTNEGGYGNTFRFLKNITGLWIIQEIARNLDHRYSFAELAKMAKTEPGFVSLINPDALRFFSPESMIQEIAQFCRETGQPVPETPGAYARCAYDSLSLYYKKAMEELCSLSRKKIDILHVVGGGSQADFLNQLTASTTGKLVQAGPVEAAALGNALAQFVATGVIPSLEEGRALIGKSFPSQRFEPEQIQGLEGIYNKFLHLVSS